MIQRTALADAKKRPKCDDGIIRDRTGADNHPIAAFLVSYLYKTTPFMSRWMPSWMPLERAEARRPRFRPLLPGRFMGKISRFRVAHPFNLTDILFLSIFPMACQNDGKAGNLQRQEQNMRPFYLLYAFLSSIFFAVFIPAFRTHALLTGRYKQHFKERLGFIPQKALKNLSRHPRIWIHAVSLGEVRVAASIINALKGMVPNVSFIVSTFTKSGRDLAEKTFGPEVSVTYAPVDFVGAVRKALSRIEPDVMVFLETEIWPAWLREARRMGIRTALINGRISLKSITGYQKMRFFFRDVLQDFDALSMITEADSRRIQSMGADPSKIVINGNAKYDLLKRNADPAAQGRFRGLFNIVERDRVLIAGSTRKGEESMLLDAYKEIRKVFPDVILLIAPRHIERTAEIGSLIEKRGFEYQLRSDLVPGEKKRSKPIVIIDTFGELFNIYSIGTIVLIGGSLVPLGGQNPLEPAVWGKAVFYGPYMENFLDAKALLEAAEAGITVRDSKMLADTVVWFLEHPGQLEKVGERARDVVLNHEGAAEKHAEVIERLLMIS